MKKIFLLFAMSLCALSAYALDLPEIIGSNMMLQQQTNAKLWGWAKGGSTVNVTTSWNNQSYAAKADKATGRWEVKVQTPAASYETYSITVKGDGQTKTIDNVLIGEVWFCSGQSNMEISLGGFWNCPIEGSNEAIANSGKYKKAIRFATIPKADALVPQDKVAGKWEICEPQNAQRFSAVGYFFARTLTDLLDVPVGIINCSWGGSCVEGWLPKEILETYPDGLTPIDDTDYHRKMVMYNGMLHPLMGYTIKGFLWNQGESNVGYEKEYFERFQTMAKLWRTGWNQPGDKLPFYTVEIPGYRYGNDENGIDAAKFREVQHKIAHSLENSGCVCTSDLVYEWEKDQIHATKKLEIGQRLAYMAATRDYGMSGFWAENPEFEKMEVVEANEWDKAVIAGTPVAANPNDKGKVTLLYFTNAFDGFDRMQDIEGFEAAGDDGIFHPAIVWSSNNDTRPLLKMVCPEVPEIKYVRYCFKNFVVGKLHNSRQLPIVPFRTDNF